MQQAGNDRSEQPERKRLTPEDMCRLYVKEKIDPLEARLMRDQAVDVKKILQDDEKVRPVKRRQFLAEKVEESYKFLLDAVRNGPDKDKHRNILIQLIEENLRWSKNNIAAVGPDHEECGLFMRVLELTEQSQQTLHEMSTTAKPPPTAPTLEVVVQKIDALHTKADAIHSTTEELKTAVPVAINGQAQVIHDREAEIGRLKAALAQRLHDMAAIYQRIAPQDMKIFVAFMREGNQVRAAESLGMKEQTLRARVSQWAGNGAAYRRLDELYQWRKKLGRAPKIVPYFDNVLYEKKPALDVDSRIMTDIAEILSDMNPMNMEEKKEVLLTQYLKEYTAT